MSTSTKQKEKNVLIEGKHVGFRAGGKLFLQRCPKCKLENYALSVSSGQCAWCGWKEEAIK